MAGLPGTNRLASLASQIAEFLKTWASCLQPLQLTSVISQSSHGVSCPLKKAWMEVFSVDVCILRTCRRDDGNISANHCSETLRTDQASKPTHDLELRNTRKCVTPQKWNIVISFLFKTLHLQFILLFTTTQYMVRLHGITKRSGSRQQFQLHG